MTGRGTARTGLRAVLLAGGLLAGPVSAQDGGGAPLSAIDWLSDSVIAVPATAPGAAPGLPSEDPVADSATVPEITVTPLDLPSPDRVGLLPPSRTGLPADLWSGSVEADLVTLVRAERVETLPAIQRLIVTLMLAEAEPPAGAGPEGRLFLARIDKLLDLGALDPALELLRAANPSTPELFRRYFDVALLTGAEDAACRLMRLKPEVAPTLQARIFCLARSGDWPAAALTLNTAVALGDVDAEEEALLARFLDPDLFEGEPPLAAPSRPSPLVFRMREAIGEGLSTATLPRAFAHADLRDTVGWKARIEAAERLARSGGVTDSRLFDLYALQRPAASGGVWDRARAMQALETALADDDGVGEALLAAWDAAREARIETAFARHFAEALSGADLTGPAAAVALRVGLLSDLYESVALDALDGGAELGAADRFLVGTARGQLTDAQARTPTETAVRAAFTGAAPDPTLLAMAGDGRLGEALLRAIAQFSEGAEGDIASATEALALFRSVGLEDFARRAALQLLILERSP